MDKTTYNKLIETGIKLFGDFGYDGVTVRDIVKESGVNLSAISYHFGGKNELYQAVVDHLVQEVNDYINHFNYAEFNNLALTTMEQRLSSILNDIHALFSSRNGISRMNIFIRETTWPDKNLSHHYFEEMTNNIHTFLHNILTTYYQLRQEPLAKIEFVICAIISILRSISQRYCVKIFSENRQDILTRLTQLILVSHL